MYFLEKEFKHNVYKKDNFKVKTSIVILAILFYSCANYEASYDLQKRMGYIAMDFGLESINHIPKIVEGKMFDCRYTNQLVIHAFGSCGIQFRQYLDSVDIKSIIDNTSGTKLKSTDDNIFFIYMNIEEVKKAMITPNIYPIPYLNSHVKRHYKNENQYEVILIEYSKKNIMNPSKDSDHFIIQETGKMDI